MKTLVLSFLLLLTGSSYAQYLTNQSYQKHFGNLLDGPFFGDQQLKGNYVYVLGHKKKLNTRFRHLP